MKVTRRVAFLALVPAILLAAAGIQTAFGQQVPPKGPVYKDVAPIFQARCILCHAGPKAAKGLRMDTYDDIMKGGDQKALIPGEPQNSLIFQRITGAKTPRMPKNGPPFLSQAETALVEQWIKTGAPK